MYRQILFPIIAFVAILFSSCGSTNPPSVVELKPGEYLGNYTVKKDGETTFQKYNVIFHVQLSESKEQMTLTMNKVKFATLMPVTLNIVAHDVACKLIDSAYVAEVAEITPTVDDVPMEKYKLYDLNVSFTDDKMNVSFFCKENIVEFEGKR